MTLRGGGLFVVDIRSTPMRIVAEYDRATIHGNGCGGIQKGRKMYVNSGGGTAANLSEFDVIDSDDDELVGEIPLAGGLSSDPSPDLLDVSPRGRRVFASLRGSLPLSGDPHVSTGNTPGVGVIRVKHGGRSGVFKGIARISNVDGSGVDRADPHALRVRER